MIRSDVLNSIAYFADLPPEILDEVAQTTEIQDVGAGHLLIEEGAPSDDMFIVVEGQMTVTKAQQGRQVELGRVGPGEIVGETGLLDRADRLASVTASVPSVVLRVPAATFDRLLEDPRVARRMFRTVIQRLRNTEVTLRHGERMAALGQMAAQLMHELNNPAAAVGRSSIELRRLHRSLVDLITEGMGADLDLEDPPANPLERSRREEGVAGWLSENGVTDVWDIAGPLVQEGWTTESLARIVSEIPNPSRYLRLIGLRAACEQLIREVSVGSRRISELVRIVKEYSFLDNAPVQELDVTDGIADTLVLFRHQLANVEVVIDFESDLRRVEAPGRDLNQVWTNLIDNAAHVMPEGGTLTISARNEGDEVVVVVSDTGPGIPDDVLPRIFDPFFTTKAPGQGTGLGLHTSYTIVAGCGGTITVDSSPSGTAFKVTLPAT